ncbi:MAG: hypothetical protein JXR44_06870 [Thiotrichales bacterium]|nr:hypothetical protein [Thiotrichales bacterium]
MAELIDIVPPLMPLPAKPIWIWESGAWLLLCCLLLLLLLWRVFHPWMQQARALKQWRSEQGAWRLYFLLQAWQARLSQRAREPQPLRFWLQEVGQIASQPTPLPPPHIERLYAIQAAAQNVFWRWYWMTGWQACQRQFQRMRSLVRLSRDHD